MPARIVSSRTDAEVALADTYGVAKARLPGSEAVRHLRDDAFGAFAAAGLPHRRVEAWHYTDLRSLMREALPVAPKTGRDARSAIDQPGTGGPAEPRRRPARHRRRHVRADALGPAAGWRHRPLAGRGARRRSARADRPARCQGFRRRRRDPRTQRRDDAGRRRHRDRARRASCPTPIEIVYASARPRRPWPRGSTAPWWSWGQGPKVALCGVQPRPRRPLRPDAMAASIVQVGDKAEVRHTSSITRTEPGSHAHRLFRRRSRRRGQVRFLRARRRRRA